MESSIEVMPKGYCLQAYDECGSRETQPHIHQSDFFVFSRESVVGLLDERTVVKDHRAITASFDDIDPNLEYVLAVSYACEIGIRREQSLWSSSTLIHDVHIIQAGRVERLLIRVPRSAVSSGKLTLEFRTETEYDAVLSSLELWAPVPAPNALFFLQLESLHADLRGQIVDIRYRKVPGSTVTLKTADGVTAAVSKSDQAGYFSFARSVVDVALGKGDVTLHAEGLGGNEGCAECHADGTEVKSYKTITECSECHQAEIAQRAFVEKPDPRWGEAAGYVDAMHSLCVECHEREVMKAPGEHPENLNRCMTCHDVDWRDAVRERLPQRESADRVAGKSGGVPRGQ